MKILSLPTKSGILNLVSVVTDLRLAGYSIIITEGKIMLDMPDRLLEGSREEELQKMSEITAEINILCQELGISFTNVVIESNTNNMPPRPNIGDVYSPDFSMLAAPDRHRGQMEPWAWRGFKGNPTDNSTWKPTKVRKGYGHNKLKGKNK